MQLKNTGGGLLTNGRTKQDAGPTQVPPMRPPQQQAAPPQQQSAPQAPPQGAPPPPQGQLPQQGQPPQEMPPEGGQPGHNDMANNALALMHDEGFAPQVEKLVSQGEEGAAEAAVMIGKQVVQAHLDRGLEPDPAQASDAIMEVVGDLADIGLSIGSIPQEPLVNDVPAGVFAIMAYAADKWTAAFPEFGESLKQEVSNATQQDEEAARQVAAYMQQRKQNANTGQSTPSPVNGAVDNSSGPVAPAPEPNRGYLG